jgi:hypothetical protein
MESADVDFMAALAMICWVCENRQEEDAENYRERAQELIERGLDLVK